MKLYIYCFFYSFLSFLNMHAMFVNFIRQPLAQLTLRISRQSTSIFFPHAIRGAKHAGASDSDSYDSLVEKKLERLEKLEEKYEDEIEAIRQKLFLLDAGEEFIVTTVVDYLDQIEDEISPDVYMCIQSLLFTLDMRTAQSKFQKLERSITRQWKKNFNTIIHEVGELMEKDKKDD